jgi:4-hydroxybenzoate polyprenyltransferase
MDLTLPAVSSILAIFLKDIDMTLSLLGKTVAVVVGAYCATVGSYVFNDFVDVDVDRENLPKRPLPSGRLNRMDALLFSIVLYAASIVIFSFYSLYSVLTVIAASAVITSYSVFFKRRTPLSFFPVGIAYGLVPIGVWFAFGGLHTAILLLGCMICITDWGFTLSGVSRDVVGDGKRSVPTMPVTYGIPFTSRFILFCWVLGVIISAIIWHSASLGMLYLVIALLSGAWLLWMNLRFVEEPTAENGGRFFIQSAKYRSVLFIALILDIALKFYRR